MSRQITASSFALEQEDKMEPLSPSAAFMLLGHLLQGLSEDQKEVAVTVLRQCLIAFGLAPPENHPFLASEDSRSVATAQKVTANSPVVGLSGSDSCAEEIGSGLSCLSSSGVGECVDRLNRPPQNATLYGDLLLSTAAALRHHISSASRGAAELTSQAPCCSSCSSPSCRGDGNSSSSSATPALPFCGCTCPTAVARASEEAVAGAASTTAASSSSTQAVQHAFATATAAVAAAGVSEDFDGAMATMASNLVYAAFRTQLQGADQVPVQPTADDEITCFGPKKLLASVISSLYCERRRVPGEQLKEMVQRRSHDTAGEEDRVKKKDGRQRTFKDVLCATNYAERTHSEDNVGEPKKHCEEVRPLPLPAATLRVLLNHAEQSRDEELLVLLLAIAQQPDLPRSAATSPNRRPAHERVSSEDKEDNGETVSQQLESSRRLRAASTVSDSSAIVIRGSAKANWRSFCLGRSSAPQNKQKRMSDASLSSNSLSDAADPVKSSNTFENTESVKELAVPDAGGNNSRSRGAGSTKLFAPPGLVTCEEDDLNNSMAATRTSTMNDGNAGVPVCTAGTCSSGGAAGSSDWLDSSGSVFPLVSAMAPALEGSKDSCDAPPSTGGRSSAKSAAGMSFLKDSLTAVATVVPGGRLDTNSVPARLTSSTCTTTGLSAATIEQVLVSLGSEGGSTTSCCSPVPSSASASDFGCVCARSNCPMCCPSAFLDVRTGSKNSEASAHSTAAGVSLAQVLPVPAEVLAGDTCEPCRAGQAAIAGSDDSAQPTCGRRVKEGTTVVKNKPQEVSQIELNKEAVEPLEQDELMAAAAVLKTFINLRRSTQASTPLALLAADAENGGDLVERFVKLVEACEAKQAGGKDKHPSQVASDLMTRCAGSSGAELKSHSSDEKQKDIFSSDMLLPSSSTVNVTEENREEEVGLGDQRSKSGEEEENDCRTRQRRESEVLSSHETEAIMRGGKDVTTQQRQQSDQAALHTDKHFSHQGPEQRQLTSSERIEITEEKLVPRPAMEDRQTSSANFSTGGVTSDRTQSEGSPHLDVLSEDKDGELKESNNLWGDRGEGEVYRYGVLLRQLGRTGKVRACWAVWSKLKNTKGLQPNAVAYGCMYDALVSNGRVVEALELFEDMKREGTIQPNTIMYSTIIKGFAQGKQLDRALSMYAEMQRNGVAINTVTFNSIVDACARVGAMDKAAMLLEDMLSQGVKPDLITFSTIIKGYCVHGEMNKALHLLGAMRERSIKPDGVLYNSLLDGCVKTGRVALCEYLWEEMQREGIPPSNFTLTILIKMHGRMYQLQKAFDLVKELPRKYSFRINAHVYTCLMAACIVNKEYSLALEVYECMDRDGVRGDPKTLSTIVGGCVKGRLFREAADILDRALDKMSANCSHGSDHFGHGGDGGSEKHPATVDEKTLRFVVHQLKAQGLGEDLGLPLVQKAIRVGLLRGRSAAAALHSFSHQPGPSFQQTSKVYPPPPPPSYGQHEHIPTNRSGNATSSSSSEWKSDAPKGMGRHVGEYSTSGGGGLGSECSSLHSHNSRWESSSHHRRSRGGEDRRMETCEDEGMQRRSFFRGRVEGKGTNNGLGDRHYSSSFNGNESSIRADSVLPPGGCPSGTEEGRLTSTKSLNAPELLLPQRQGVVVDRMEMFPGTTNERINSARLNLSSETAGPSRGPEGHLSLPPPPPPPPPPVESRPVCRREGLTPRQGDDVREDDPSRFRSDRVSPHSSERENADGWLEGFSYSSNGIGAAATFRNCKSSNASHFLPTLLNTQLPATPPNIDSSLETSTRGGRGSGGEQAATSNHHRLPGVGFPDRRVGHSGGDEGDRTNWSEPRIARLRSLEKRGYEPVFTKEIRPCQQQEDDYETASMMNHMQMTAAANSFPHSSSSRFRDLRGETERDFPGDDVPQLNDARYPDFQFLCLSEGERGSQGRDNFQPKERRGADGFSAPVLMGEKAYVAAASHNGAFFPSGYASHPSEDSATSSRQTSLRDIRTGFFDNCMQASTASTTPARPPGIMKSDFLMKMVPSETGEVIVGGTDGTNCFSPDLLPRHMKDGCRWAVGERLGEREGGQQVLEASFHHKTRGFFLQPPPPPPASNLQRDVGAALPLTEQLIENRNRQRRQPQE